MRISLVMLFCLVLPAYMYAQEKMYIHLNDRMTLGAPVDAVEDIFFSNENSHVNFVINSKLFQYPVSEIDSISFGEESGTVLINYDGVSVSVVNPLAFEGISVTAEGAHVTVTSTNEDEEASYRLSGITTDGLFKIYSDLRFNLLLDGVSIKNPEGPAINVQSGKKCTLILNGGTENSLADGTVYRSSAEDQKSALFSEGQLVINGKGYLEIKSLSKHAICSDDYISIQSGTISVSEAPGDGIHCNDQFEMSGGTLSINSSGDGIESENGFISVSGGDITTYNSAANTESMKSGSTMAISGGNISMTVTGDQSKGLKSAGEMTLSGGSIIINTSGSAVLIASPNGYDPSYCTAIKCNSTISVDGSEITINTTGKGSRGISSDADIYINSGTLNINTSGEAAVYLSSPGTFSHYTATCLRSDGNTEITGGNVALFNSGPGGKCISTDGMFTLGNISSSPIVILTTTGDLFQVSTYEFSEPRTVKSDGYIYINNGSLLISSNDDALKSQTGITINNGTITINKSTEGIEAPFITINGGKIEITASNDGINATYGNQSTTDDGSCLTISGGYIVADVSTGDGIDSNGDIVISAGIVIIHGPTLHPEVGLDFNGIFNISGGLLVASGSNSGMTKAPGSASVQYSLKAVSNARIPASTLFHIEDTDGNSIITFSPVRDYYSVIVSSPDFVKHSSYNIYTGGSSTGFVLYGLYFGGTYSGGTQRDSFFISTKVTSVEF